MSRAVPSISIVLPTYNRAAYILETIQTVLGQSFRDWELLVIDDSSTDNTADLINRIHDERITLIRINQRVGITASREKGVQESKADLIAFIDSDDLWDRFKLEKQIAALQEYPDAGFCLTGGYTFNEPGKPLVYYYQQKEGMHYGDLMIPLFKSEISALTPTLVFRKNCLEKINFTTHVEFILGLAAYYKGIVIYEPLLQRRLHESNTSVLEWENREKEGIRILKKYGKLVPRHIANEILFKAYVNSGENYLSHNKNGKAIACFFHAWSKRPISIIPLKKIGKAGIKALFK